MRNWPAALPTITIEHWNGYTPMKCTSSSLYLSFCFTLVLVAAGRFDAALAAQDGLEKKTRQHPQQSDPHNLTGKITDVIAAGGITYVEVDTGPEKVWAAGKMDHSLATGDTVSFSTAMPMNDFHSKTLNRDFAVIYFVQHFMTGSQASNSVAPSGQTGQPQLPRATFSSTAGTPGEVPTGSLLHDASLDGLNTKNKRLSDYKGKPLIINVWASWCGPCRAEMGSLEQLAKRYNGRMFNIIGISTDDYRDKAAAFIEQAGVTFENYIDHELRMEHMLGAATIPLTILVDADGRVLQKVRGSREWDSPDIVEAIGKAFGIKLI